MMRVDSPFIEGARERAALRKDALEKRRRELLALAKQAATLLASQFAVAEVVLFGSCARGDTWEGSDIDLLVRGLAAERFYEAAGALAMLCPSLTIVPAERASSALIADASASGLRLHP